MTEEEAKTKWCPFVRAVSVDSGHSAANRIALPKEAVALPVSARCIASACMAWRMKPVPTPGGEGRLSRVEGFCGLAGQP